MQPVISRREAPSAAQDWGLALHDNPPNGVQPFVRVSQFRRNVPRETQTRVWSDASSGGEQTHVNKWPAGLARGVMRRHGNATGRDDQPTPHKSLRVPTRPCLWDESTTNCPHHGGVFRRSWSRTRRTADVHRSPRPAPDTYPFPVPGSADTPPTITPHPTSAGWRDLSTRTVPYPRQHSVREWGSAPRRWENGAVSHQGPVEPSATILVTGPNPSPRCSACPLTPDPGNSGRSTQIVGTGFANISRRGSEMNERAADFTKAVRGRSVRGS